MSKAGELLKKIEEIGFGMDAPVFYVADGNEYRWPSVHGWEITDVDGCDRFDSCTKVQYQHYESGLLVDFDGSKMEKGGKGTWEFEDYGKIHKGSFSNVDLVAKELSGIIRDNDKRQKNAFRKIPKVSGWDMDTGGGQHNVEVGYDKKLPLHGHWMSVAFWDISIALSGDAAEVTMDCYDDSGYQRAGVLSKSGGYTLKTIAKVLNNFEKDCKKKLGIK